MSPLQNGTNCRLGRIVAFWNLGRIVAFWNLGRIVAWDESSLFGIWDELSFWNLGPIVALRDLIFLRLAHFAIFLEGSLTGGDELHQGFDIAVTLNCKHIDEHSYAKRQPG